MWQSISMYFGCSWNTEFVACILLSHCHSIKEMVAQKELWNLEEDKLAIEFHM